MSLNKLEEVHDSLLEAYELMISDPSFEYWEDRDEYAIPDTVLPSWSATTMCLEELLTRMGEHLNDLRERE